MWRIEVFILLLISSCCFGTPDQLGNPVIIRQCGLRNINGLDPTDNDERINESKFGEFPWMVALLRKTEPDKLGRVSLFLSGGGSLIHPKAVITAAHCVVNKNTVDRLVIRAGEWDPRNRNEYLPYHERDAAKIIVHEDYYRSHGSHSDFAIIILKTPFVLKPHIGLACLPDRLNDFDSSQCISTGWGRKVFDTEPDQLKILKKVELPLIPKKACENSYHKSEHSNGFMHPSFRCAGGDYGKDTCSFDSGGPLVCQIKDDPTRYVQVGIVAAGPTKCGLEGYPSFYSDIVFGRTWILEQLKDNDLIIDQPRIRPWKYRN